MNRPNAGKYYDPQHWVLADVFRELRSLGRNRMSVCEQIGVPYRTMSDYLNKNHKSQVDYCTQFTLEAVLMWERLVTTVMSDKSEMASLEKMGENHQIMEGQPQNP